MSQSSGFSFFVLFSPNIALQFVIIDSSHCSSVLLRSQKWELVNSWAQTNGLQTKILIPYILMNDDYWPTTKGTDNAQQLKFLYGIYR